MQENFDEAAHESRRLEVPQAAHSPGAAKRCPEGAAGVGDAYFVSRIASQTPSVSRSLAGSLSEGARGKCSGGVFPAKIQNATVSCEKSTHKVVEKASAVW